ncbi:B9 domain-containing protein 1 [Sitodiplosis mosellana]|uniref:B9 domain-containing protein 1 n=1 Tax=Sitodiplosis mosellana TaxID=263140 RepID=UPI002444B1BF|nr:B9 domain-containing protein 1 [Sitodiplosis mosellana]
MEASEYFFINVTGQIDCAYYPIGFDGHKLFVRYDVVAGPDWELVSGFSSGVTQNASVGQSNDKVVFNMPMEMMFKSTNPFGWPQIVFSLYGTNWWRAESSKGYARIHVPLGGKRTTTRAPILTAQCSNLWSSLSSWFTDRRPELRDPKILLEGTKNKGLTMESYGELVVTLQSITRGGDALCLEWN